MPMLEKIKKVVAKIKQVNPLVLNITNDVTMEFIANGLLSVGASPVMSQAQEEIDDLLQLANTVVINMGTLNETFISLVKHVCRSANQLKKPIVLDPVGAGASRYRTQANLALLNQYDITILRANASEVMALADAGVITKGVDSTVQSELAIESAHRLSLRHQAAVVVSGKTDIVIDGNNYQQLSYGSALMPQITGTGCLLSAMVATFQAVEKNRFNASVLATAYFGICGERAEKHAQKPASFKTRFLDELNGE